MSNNDIVPNFDTGANQYVSMSLRRISEKPNALVCSVAGLLDTTNSTYFHSTMNKCFEYGYNTIIFDLRSLSYASSTGIGAFTFLLKSARAIKGNIILAQVPPRTLEVLQLLGFESFFTISKTVDDAVSSLLETADKKEVVASPKSAQFWTFPRTIHCPACNKLLKVPREGTFRCSICKGVLRVNSRGEVS